MDPQPCSTSNMPILPKGAYIRLSNTGGPLTAHTTRSPYTQNPKQGSGYESKYEPPIATLAPEKIRWEIFIQKLTRPKIIWVIILCLVAVVAVTIAIKLS
ncbi:hypothetical protein BDW74DRAFT_177036 [Aspergillus multicolor]|uniref:uncharacterized protein n=1 Tax=Aspergillus multicolor TaxID=41759 RepID=UPI003CCCE24A